MKIYVTFLLIISAVAVNAAELPVFDKLWDYNHPDSTEAKFREILPLAEESGNQDYHAQLLTQIARTQGLQMKFEEAQATLDQAEKLLNDSTKIAKARYLLERGRVFNSSKMPDKAKPLFVEAYDYCIAQKLDRLALDAAHMMGIVEDPAGQIEWNKKAIAVAEVSDSPGVKGWLGPLYNNIGWTYHDQGDYDSALVYFQKGYEFRNSLGNDEDGTRIAKWCIGRCYRSLGRLDEAMTIQHEIVADFETKGIPNSGYSWEELGELYLLKAEPDSAKKYFKLAYEVLSQDEWLQRDEQERLERMRKLAD